MKRLLAAFFVLILSVSLYAEVEPDVYFANGMMHPYSKEDTLINWKIYLFQPNYLNVQGGTPQVAYNRKEGFWSDVMEAYAQAHDDGQWDIFIDSIGMFLYQISNLFNYLFGDSDYDEAHSIDLSEQLAQYRESIAQTKPVIVVAHSQGNYFTNEAYKILREEDGLCFFDDFKVIALATPASYVAGNGPHFTYDDDWLIKLVPYAMSGNMENTESQNPYDPFESHNDWYLFETTSRFAIGSTLQKYVIEKHKND